jgi:hypothetical protein
MSSYCSEKSCFFITNLKKIWHPNNFKFFLAARSLSKSALARAVTEQKRIPGQNLVSKLQGGFCFSLRT